MLGLAAPAAAQSITVISPHAGEQVGAAAHWGGYWVRWSASTIPDNAGFFVSYIDGGGEERLICATGPAARACDWFEPDWVATRLFVEARNSTGATLARAESGPFEVISENLPVAWRHLDIGAVGRSGGAWGHDGGNTVSVRGAGGDIWGTADAFHAAFLENWDDVDATFTIAGLEGTHRWTKVGVMVRENLLPGAPHHFVLTSRSMGLAYQRRLAQDGESLHTSLSSSSALPVTVQVMRRANHMVMDMRQGDGPWQRAAEFGVDGPRLLGMAVTSHDINVLADGLFTGIEARFSEASVQILAPQAGEQLLAGVPYTISWEHAQLVNVSTVSYTVDGGQSWTVIPGCASITTTTCQWDAPGPVTESARIRVVVEDPDDRRAWNVTWPFAIRAPSGGGELPSGWRSFDVGAVGAPGSAAYDPAAEQFTVEGSGADIWDTADAFHFAAMQLPRWRVEDDFDVTVRVRSVENVHRWTKAGIMVRSGTGAGAPHASFFATPTTERGVAFQRRRTTGAPSVHTAGPSIAPPVWLKLIVRGGDVRAYYRHRTADPWTFLGADIIQFTGTVFEVGLAVTSHRDGTLARATFDHVSVRRPEFADEQDIGAVGVPGAGDGDDVTRTISGSGADIWGTADAFRYRWLPVWSHATISARVLSIEPTHHWAKAGVMIREDTSPGSRHVMLIVSPARGIAMQYRAVTNGPSDNVAIVPGAAPAWLRLMRSGSFIIGEASDDGETWREIGRIDLPMGEVVTGGLAVTSHNNSTRATAVFDDIILRPWP